MLCLVPIEAGDGGGGVGVRGREVVESSFRLSAASLISKIADPNTVWEAISGHRLCPLGHEWGTFYSATWLYRAWDPNTDLIIKAPLSSRSSLYI